MMTSAEMREQVERDACAMARAFDFVIEHAAEMAMAAGHPLSTNAILSAVGSVAGEMIGRVGDRATRRKLKKALMAVVEESIANCTAPGTCEMVPVKDALH